MSYRHEFEVAVDAVRQAGQLCRGIQARLAERVLDKADASPVTAADFACQALVCRALGAAFPDDPVIGEEGAAMLRQPEGGAVLAQVVDEVRSVVPGVDPEAVCTWIDRGGARTYSDRFWTLDPIDGTKGFIRGGQYAVALALIVDGEVQVAALACPGLGRDPVQPAAEGTLYAAVRGRGAVGWPLGGRGDPAPVRVSEVRDGAQARLCESLDPSFSPPEVSGAVLRRLGITAEPLRLDSQVKYVLVARGDAEVYLRLPRRPGYVENVWDHAAGVLVATEAGGRVTDVDGQPLDFSQGAQLARQSRGLVATNGAFHAAVLETVQAMS